ncbi:phosphomannomutase/phosphoglucomutase [Agromyces sp. NPDC055520]
MNPAAPSGARARLDAIVKTYDVRGIVGEGLTVETVEALAAAFVDEVGASAGASASGAGGGAAGDRGRVVVGHDMRDSSPGFAEAFARGASARGADVVSIGLCSTDESYFASGSMHAPAAMFTASHNPAAYNGIKFSRAGAQGISLDTGLAAIRDRAADYLEQGGVPAVASPGVVTSVDVLAEYAAHLRSLVDLSGIRSLKVVVDAGNGMGGLTVPAVLGTAAGLAELPLEIVPLYFELDGTFPNHEANPLEPANLVDLQRAVVEHGADLGLAFDGDADRCFVVDERGGAVNPSAVAAIVALREIARVRAAGEADVSVIHNLITSRFVSETIEAAGATPVRTRVGHSLIKDQMRATGAVFGGEHSAHYYFRDFWGADNGMLAAMHVLAEFGAQDAPLSEMSTRFTPYSLSGEINSVVDDVPAAYTRIVEAFTDRAEFDELDGLTVTGVTAGDEAFWWFNVRPSNTEPLLRLNAEGGDAATMAAIRDEVLALIRG